MTFSERTQALIDWAERDVADLPFERVHVIAPQAGVILFSSDGNEQEVAIPAKWLWNRAALIGAVSVHNHPKLAAAGRTIAAPPSLPDVQTHFGLGLLETRVVAPEGVYIFRTESPRPDVPKSWILHANLMQLQKERLLNLHLAADEWWGPKMADFWSHMAERLNSTYRKEERPWLTGLSV